MNLLTFLFETNDPFAELPENLPTKTEKLITYRTDERSQLYDFLRHTQARLNKQFRGKIQGAYEVVPPGYNSAQVGGSLVHHHRDGTPPDPEVIHAGRLIRKVQLRVDELSAEIKSLKEKRAKEIVDGKLAKADTVLANVPQQEVDQNVARVLVMTIQGRNLTSKERKPDNNPYWAGVKGQYSGPVLPALVTEQGGELVDYINGMLIELGLPVLSHMFASYDKWGHLVFAIRNRGRSVMILREHHGSGAPATRVVIGKKEWLGRTVLHKKDRAMIMRTIQAAA